MKNRQWLLSKRPVNQLSKNNFEWVEKEVECIKKRRVPCKKLIFKF
jgi:hypothetical protein